MDISVGLYARGFRFSALSYRAPETWEGVVAEPSAACEGAAGFYKRVLASLVLRAMLPHFELRLRRSTSVRALSSPSLFIVRREIRTGYLCSMFSVNVFLKL